MRGIFPPKPDSKCPRAYQQIVALGIDADADGLKVAIAESIKIGVLRDCQKFEWEPYLRIDRTRLNTLDAAIARFEKEYGRRDIGVIVAVKLGDRSK